MVEGPPNVFSFGSRIPPNLHERLEAERATALQQKNIVVQQALEMYLTRKEEERRENKSQ
jgi:hypothetical protein